MELFHVLNRGVDGRDIFMNDCERIRFIHNLYEFNDTKPANNNSGYHFKSRDIVSPYIARKREKLVDIHGWVLMKNHYHLLLSECVDDGITTFIRKLNIGYAKYFNEQHKRTGTLFQGRTKKILIESDAHFLYILQYIHLNPLDYLKGSETWRVRSNIKISNLAHVLAYLESYRWSSYLDYAGKKNFPSILTTTLFKDKLHDPQTELKKYLRDAEQHNNDIVGLTLE
jgi:putative transposase